MDGQNDARDRIIVSCPASNPAKLADRAKATAETTRKTQENIDVRLAPMRSA